MALADDAVALKLDGLIGFSGGVPGGLHTVRSPNLPGDREWLVYPLGSQVVVRQSGGASSSNLTFLTGHNDDVSCVCVSRDGRTLVSGQNAVQGVMSDVLVWNLEIACECALSGEPAAERALKHRLRQHKSGVQSVAINANDTFLATLGGRDDNAWVIWDPFLAAAEKQISDVRRAPPQSVGRGRVLTQAAPDGCRNGVDEKNYVVSRGVVGRRVRVRGHDDR